MTIRPRNTAMIYNGVTGRMWYIMRFGIKDMKKYYTLTRRMLFCGDRASKYYWVKFAVKPEPKTFIERLRNSFGLYPLTDKTFFMQMSYGDFEEFKRASIKINMKSSPEDLMKSTMDKFVVLCKDIIGAEND